MIYFYNYYVKKDEMGRILSMNAVNVYSPYRPTSSVGSPNLNISAVRVQTLADVGDILAYLVSRPVSPSASGSDF
jgi:repressor of nif and glnA expression